MDTKQKLENALREAIRVGNEAEKRAIRMALSSIRLEEVNRGTTLDETGLQAVLQREIKIRREAIEDAVKAKRQDLIDENTADLQILERFIPKQLSEGDLSDLVNEVIQEVQAVGLSDMGKVMKAILPRIQGRASNETVSRIVRQNLSK